MTLSLRFAARSDVGLLRDNNEDSAYASPHLLVLCDGVGGHVAGEVASSVAVASLAALDEDVPGPDLLQALAEAVERANEQLGQMIDGDPELEGMGTTLTALLWAGNRLGLAHVGDSRGYLLRDGELTQITRDHTFVQTLVDEGRISPDEASHHPQRSLIMKALDGRGTVEPDLSIREVRAGDRYLLCSDGLSDVVTADTLGETLRQGTPDQACEALIQLALRGGGPDNITCVIGDIVEGEPLELPPAVVGAALATRTTGPQRVDDSPASRAAALRPRPAGADDDESADQPEDGDGAGRHRRRRAHWGLRVGGALVVLAVLAGLGAGLVAWSHGQYYVGADSGQVAIYQGLPQGAGGLRLSHVYERQDVRLADLPTFYREQVQDTIDTRGLADAHKVVAELRVQAERCIAQRQAPRPTPSASTAATPGTRTPGASPAATGKPATPGTSASPQPTGALAPAATASPVPPGVLDCGEPTP